MTVYVLFQMKASNTVLDPLAKPICAPVHTVYMGNNNGSRDAGRRAGCKFLGLRAAFTGSVYVIQPPPSGATRAACRSATSLCSRSRPGLGAHAAPTLSPGRYSYVTGNIRTCHYAPTVIIPSDCALCRAADFWAGGTMTRSNAARNGGLVNSRRQDVYGLLFIGNLPCWYLPFPPASVTFTLKALGMYH